MGDGIRGRFGVYHASKDGRDMYRKVGRAQILGRVGRQVISRVCRRVKCLLFGEAFAVRAIILSKFWRGLVMIKW